MVLAALTKIPETDEQLKDINTRPHTYYAMGFIIFFTIFMATIPYFLYNWSYRYFLYYTANIDMLANILSSLGKPSIFSRLYMGVPDSFIAYFSLISINFYVLIAICHIAIEFAYQTDKFTALLRAGVMVMTTFLLPTYLLPLFIDMEEKILEKEKDKETNLTKFKLFLILITSLLFGMTFIYLEDIIISNIPGIKHIIRYFVPGKI